MTLSRPPGDRLPRVSSWRRGRDRAIAEQQQVGATERALLEERARIVRELHDVVAHHMSVIAVQADSAPYRLPRSTPVRAPSSPRSRSPRGTAFFP
jgi:signal transduction histidine kinase